MNNSKCNVSFPCYLGEEIYSTIEIYFPAAINPKTCSQLKQQVTTWKVIGLLAALDEQGFVRKTAKIVEIKNGKPTKRTRKIVLNDSGYITESVYYSQDGKIL